MQIKKALQQYPDKRLMCIKSGDFNLADPRYLNTLAINLNINYNL